MGRNRMILRLTKDETQELRNALIAAQRETLRDLASHAGCGHSSRGVELCRRRARIEELLNHLEDAPALVVAREGFDNPVQLAEAA